jgi:hypothetical protein
LSWSAAVAVRRTERYVVFAWREELKSPGRGVVDVKVEVGEV